MPTLPTSCLQDPGHGGRGAGHQSHFRLTLFVNDAQAQCRALHPLFLQPHDQALRCGGAPEAPAGPPCSDWRPAASPARCGHSCFPALHVHLLSLRHASAGDVSCPGEKPRSPPSGPLSGYLQKGAHSLLYGRGEPKCIFLTTRKRGPISLAI